MNSARQSSERLRLELNADAMGTTFSIILFGPEQVMMEAAVDAAFDELRRLDEMLSDYRPESEWSEVNRRAAGEPMKISPELFRLLSLCIEYSRQSEGAFDITSGPLIKAWGFFKGTGRMPEKAEIAAALAAAGYMNLRLDPANSTVQFGLPGMELSPGGIGKGYAVDRMVEILKQKGFDTALVAASGSSIYGLGRPPGESSGWRVELRDPVNPRRTATEVFLMDMSISTSGSSEKQFWTDGRAYSHIIDPRTGYPAQGSLLVSVISPHAVDSEAWTKACLINGREWAGTHKPRDFCILFYEDKAGPAFSWL